jgi:multicomponent Na+:H+ antiporter subunit A
MRTGFVGPITVMLPFLGAALVPLLGPWLKARTGYALALIPAAILFLVAPLGLDVASATFQSSWIPELGLSVSFRVDTLSLAFVLLIATVALAVFPFAAAYVGDDRRFLATLSAFMGAMLGLVLADDLVLLFVFWELTSITSFLLISHRHESFEARRAARQGFLITFTGGLGLLAAAAGLGVHAGTTQISAMPGPFDADPAYGIIATLVIFAAFTKSAQFPFHFWLPNAMEAPTPVSAFLHSATMVQAGVYLLARLDPILGGTPLWNQTLFIGGCLTALVGAVLSLTQRDLKRLLAYSTVGALGLLVAAIGLRAWGAFFAFFLAHGLYKGALFLVAGSLEKGARTRNATAIRGYGRTSRPLQILAGLAALSMAAIPGTFGYVGKEELLQLPSVAFGIVVALYGAASLAVAYLVGVRPFLGEASEGQVPVKLGFWGPAGLPALVGVALVPFAEPIGRTLAGKGWYFVPPGYLSMIAWVGGAGLVVLWQLRMPAWQPPHAPSLDLTFEWLGNRMARLAAAIVHRIQHGYLNGYVRAVFGTLIVLVAYGIARALPTAKPERMSTPNFYETAIALAMIGGAVAAVVSRSRLGAVAALGIVGYGVAIVYVRFGAPDLAMTQIAVETLTLILFVFTFYRLPRPELRKNPGPRVRDAIVATAAGATMAALTWIASGIPNDGQLAQYFAGNAYPGGKGHNVVNVILVDFRGFDTLGEITVLAVASLGVYALLSMPRRGGDPSAR